MSSQRPVTRLDKSDTLSGLFASWEAIDRLLADLPAERWDTPTELPGWAVRDVVAHIVGTELMLLGSPIPEPDTDVAALPHVHNQIGQWNECWVRELRGESVPGLLEKFRDVTSRRRAVLAAVDVEGWNAAMPTPVGIESLGRFMRIRTFDCWMHEHDIRAGLEMPAADDDFAHDDSRLAIDELMASMAYVVGKLGQAPRGSRVQIELTGPLARSIRVAVDERAALVDHFDRLQPTATIRVDGLHFTRLCGGRVAPATQGDDFVFDGDIAVATRIAERLPFVF